MSYTFTGKVVIDATPNYIVSWEAAARIKQTYGDQYVCMIVRIYGGVHSIAAVYHHLERARVKDVQPCEIRGYVRASTPRPGKVQ